MIHPALIVIAAASQGPVHLRGEPLPDPRPVVEVTIEGVKVGGESPETLGWERVRELTGDDAGKARGFEWLIDDAWRALARVRRGDLELAGPALERMDEALRPVRSTTALLAASGLASLRAQEARVVDAVEPALRVRALHRAGVTLDEVLLETLGYDEETGLWPLLPPLPIGNESIASWAGLPERVGITRPDETTEVIAAWYARAAELAGAAAPEGPPITNNDSGSASLVSAMVNATLHPDMKERLLARAVLDNEIEANPGGWREAWARIALGRSHALAGDETFLRRGLVELLTAASLVSVSHPPLAAIALADAAAIAESLGMRTQAGTLWSLANELSPPGLIRSGGGGAR